MDDELQQRIFERVRDTLEEMHEQMEELKGEHQVPADELFPPAFMSEHTSFERFDAFLEAGGFEVGEGENLEAAVSKDDLHRHVRDTTTFDSWAEMREDAEEAWVLDRLKGGGGSGSGAHL